MLIGTLRLYVVNPRSIGTATVVLIGITLLNGTVTVSYTHLRAHETVLDLVCRLLLEKKKLLSNGGLSSIY